MKRIQTAKKSFTHHENLSKTLYICMTAFVLVIGLLDPWRTIKGNICDSVDLSPRRPCFCSNYLICLSPHIHL